MYNFHQVKVHGFPSEEDLAHTIEYVDGEPRLIPKGEGQTKPTEKPTAPAKGGKGKTTAKGGKAKATKPKAKASEASGGTDTKSQKIRGPSDMEGPWFCSECGREYGTTRGVRFHWKSGTNSCGGPDRGYTRIRPPTQQLLDSALEESQREVEELRKALELAKKSGPAEAESISTAEHERRESGKDPLPTSNRFSELEDKDDSDDKSVDSDIGLKKLVEELLLSPPKKDWAEESAMEKEAQAAEEGKTESASVESSEGARVSKSEAGDEEDPTLFKLSFPCLLYTSPSPRDS